MTNLKKYYGIDFCIAKEVDPLKITVLKEKALNIAKLVGFNISEFFVYLHTISFRPSQTHFAKHLAVSDKVKELEIKFSVNKKQINAGSVKFYNAYANIDIPHGCIELYGDTELTRFYPGTMLKQPTNFSTELITYVSRKLRSVNHKKIKVTLTPFPTPLYSDILTTNPDYIHTKADLKLEEDVHLAIKPRSYLDNILISMEMKEIRRKTRTKGSVVNNYNVTIGDGNRDIQIGNDNILTVKQKESINDSLSKVIANIKSSGEVSELDKEDAEADAKRISDLTGREQTNEVVEKISARIASILAIVKKGKSLYDTTWPIIEKLPSLFGN